MLVARLLVLVGCVMWQPYAVQLEPPPYSEFSPTYTSQVECNRRAFHAVKHACYRSYSYKDREERLTCVLKTMPQFQCIPVPCKPLVDPDQAVRVG